MPTAAKRPPPPPPPIDEPVDNGGIPEQEKKPRSPKLQKLESSVAGSYIMLGGALSTLPEQIGGQRVRLVGLSLASSADEIAEAWLDLAEDDRRVLKMLESLTSFSGWGKVIGVHLIAVGSAVPGIQGAMPQGFSPFQQQQQQSQQQSNGMTDAAAAMMMAEMFRQAQSAQRAEAQQAPPPGYGEAPPPPSPPPQQQQQQAGARPVSTPQTVARPGRGAGIPSAAELFGGQSATPDVSLEFPSAGSDSVQG